MFAISYLIKEEVVFIVFGGTGSVEIKERYAQIRWEDFATARNFFAHIYFGVNIERVWQVVKEFIPTFKVEIKNIREKVF